MRKEVCTCGAPWPCSGPESMGDHSLGCITSEDGVLMWTPCGDECHGDHGSEQPPADRCSHCEPMPCTTCDGFSHRDAFCGCWTPLGDLNPADVKALFARDGWGVGTDGRVET